MNVATPYWVDALTAACVVVGALAALIGSFGLLRLGSFFQRVHAPTLGATMGTWGLTLATVWQASFVSGQPYVHAVLIAVFIAVTAPVTAVFLMRAALFRARSRGDADVPLLDNDGGSRAIDAHERKS
jgi:multicomponent K+:H+ antiporter subunit G